MRLNHTILVNSIDLSPDPNQPTFRTGPIRPVQQLVVLIVRLKHLLLEQAVSSAAVCMHARRVWDCKHWLIASQNILAKHLHAVILMCIQIERSR